MVAVDMFNAKKSAPYAPKTAKSGSRKIEGRPVGVIAVRPKHIKPGAFNPCIIFFTVNPYRKDYNKVVEQLDRPGRLPKYEQSLFDSCFKNW